ncbi:nucleotidyl transferase AbiEii/AbiGii toxin family protein [Helicobacter pylori]|uniref:nucleotidyl transferase AbiEii/AbiGii toxin family protein n=1 Tax=Helicobacter pylori TaxID=210 RepID=UPI0035A81D29
MDSKKPHYRVSLSEQALNHEKLMRAIVKNLADTPMVLKGGTALYLGYGLNRFSEDLDFDCHKKINLLGRVKSAIPNGIILNDIHIKKDPDKLVSDYLVDVKLDALLNQIMDLEETALELGVMAQLIHKKLEKQSHSLNALQEQQGYSNNDNSLDNSNENTYTPKRRR